MDRLLRNYQSKAIDDILRQKKNLVYLATGSGKSIIFKQIINNALEQNKKVLFLVARQQVLNQAYEKHFYAIKEKSLMMGPNKFELKNLLCASIDTLARRVGVHDEIINKYDLFIVDECHDCTAPKYKNFLDLIPSDKTIIGFSATPFKVGRKTHHFWNHLIHPTTTLDLIKQKHLVFPEVYSAEIEMKTTKKLTGGDFNQKDLFLQNDDMKVYGDIVNEYKKHGHNKKAFCFAINIEHSKKIAQEFSRNEIYAVHVDSSHSAEYRKEVLWEFENGNIQVLCNVNLFSTGTDIPCVEVGIMARPTKSRILWVQQVGRILRPSKGKEKALILDHGGNTFRLGHPINDFPADISEITKNDSSEPELKVYKCQSCFYIFSENTTTCPMCGEKNQVVIRKIKEQKDLELKKIDQALLEKEKKAKEDIKNRPYDNYEKWYFKKYSGSNEGVIELQDKIKKSWEKIKIKRQKPAAIFYAACDIANDLRQKNSLSLVLKFPKWFKQNEQI